MKSHLLAVLLTLILAFAPWRLVALAGETMMMRPSISHFTSRDDLYYEALALEARLLALGYSVKYQTGLNFMGQEAWGLTVPTEHQIYVEERLHWNARYAVLAHEAGHVLQPDWVDREEGDAFAEIVAALVTHDGLREHARFLARSKGAFLITAIAGWQEAYHAADLLTD